MHQTQMRNGILEPDSTAVSTLVEAAAALERVVRGLSSHWHLCELTKVMKVTSSAASRSSSGSCSLAEEIVMRPQAGADSFSRPASTSSGAWSTLKARLARP